jgi:hypothetical protein
MILCEYFAELFLDACKFLRDSLCLLICLVPYFRDIINRLAYFMKLIIFGVVAKKAEGVGDEDAVIYHFYGHLGTEGLAVVHDGLSDTTRGKLWVATMIKWMRKKCDELDKHTDVL